MLPKKRASTKTETGEYEEGDKPGTIDQGVLPILSHTNRFRRQPNQRQFNNSNLKNKY